MFKHTYLILILLPVAACALGFTAQVIRPGFRRHSRPSLRVAPFKLYRGQVAS
ncbi:Hypothetical Protein PD5205_00673 [Xanthomonas fragariae]|uniref:Uncharacterized protein n=1 Tax=Xanthomonas fragariae TaxID=48664 RepID=A0A1Y6HAM4_9XANT|nr:Hypothetical Protein NBC2815_03335 [Xanthomonas fragariae]SMR00558.1 hypothetical protein PD885_03337 [Xanthomonas fragariae]SMR01993.1 Hypothetical Protein PD5205_00673 [Xanthomonas fragariae]